MNTHDVMKLADSLIAASIEEHYLNDLRKLRTENAETFAKAVHKTVKSFGEDKGMAFLISLHLTSIEQNHFLKEVAQEKGLTFDEVLRYLDNPAADSAPAPTAEELLIKAFRALSSENPAWKPFQFKRFVESRMNRHLLPASKPFTNQDVMVGAEWYLTIKKILRPNATKRIRDHCRASTLLIKNGLSSTGSVGGVKVRFLLSNSRKLFVIALES